MAPLGIDIEHIADSHTWAEQAWRLIRERREHERKEVEDRERARLDEQQRKRRDEKEWRERQLLLSQQRAAAFDTAELPSSSAHRRARTARQERREKQQEAESAVDIQAGAMSGWQQRGLLHVWTSEGSREQEDKERREIWEGNMRGKRAQVERIEAERKKQADKQATAKRTTKQRRPQTAAAAYRPATAAVRPSTAARSAWTARPRPSSPPPPVARPAARPCIRCALPSISFAPVELVALVAEHDHLSRLLHSPSSVVVPSAIRRLWPQLSAEQYSVRCGDSTWLGSQVDVCHECAEWLDDNKHATARRKRRNDTGGVGSSDEQKQQRQRSTLDDNGSTSDDESGDDGTSVRSITQLVNRVLTMPSPSQPLG